jgi:hypothetical protein
MDAVRLNQEAHDVFPPTPVAPLSSTEALAQQPLDENRFPSLHRS